MYWTPEQHRRQADRALHLIHTGRVATWVALGREFGITGQAAHARFGPKGYGIRMPEREPMERWKLSVTLDPALHEMIEILRDRFPDDSRPSKAQVVREILARELPYEAFPPQLAGAS